MLVQDVCDSSVHLNGNVLIFPLETSMGSPFFEEFFQYPP